MRTAAGLILLAALAAGQPAAAQAPARSHPGPPTTSTAPKVPELAADLRVLGILNALRATPAHLKELAAVATAGREGLADIDAEAKAALDQHRDSLLAAREALVQGRPAPTDLDARLAAASASAEATRARKMEALVAALATRVRALLTSEQAALIETDLAPPADQPWRRYERGPASPAVALPGAARPPNDPEKWSKELRTLRELAARADPKAAADGFARKVAAGARAGTPLSEEALARGRAIAQEALALPAGAFVRREWELARVAAKQEAEIRNRRRAEAGRPLPTFDAARWLVEQVLLSPRAAAALGDRAAAR